MTSAGRRGVGDEGRLQTEPVGQQAAGEAAGADGEEEDALVGRHHPAADGLRSDVGQDDLPAGQDHRRPGAGDESGAEEDEVVGRDGAEQVADDGQQPAEGEQGPAPAAGSASRPAGTLIRKRASP